jgi:hypothetical protein
MFITIFRMTLRRWLRLTPPISTSIEYARLNARIGELAEKAYQIEDKLNQHLRDHEAGKSDHRKEL